MARKAIKPKKQPTNKTQQIVDCCSARMAHLCLS